MGNYGLISARHPVQRIPSQWGAANEGKGLDGLRATGHGTPMSPRDPLLPLPQWYFWQHYCAGPYKVAVAVQGAALSAARWDMPQSRSAT